jgi:hypothetical protein
VRKANEREELTRKISEVKIHTSLSRYVMSGEGRGAPSKEALADRNRRAKMKETRDLTGIVLGDPPPGRSALDAYKAKTAEPKIKSIWEGFERAFKEQE